MNDITVRLAKPEDFKQVQELNHQLFLSDSRHFDDLNTNWPYEEGESYFRKRIAGEGGVCFVAERDGVVAGYEQFLRRTDTTDEKLLEALADASQLKEMLEASYRFADNIFRSINAIGDGTKLHRMVVV